MMAYFIMKVMANSVPIGPASREVHKFLCIEPKYPHNIPAKIRLEPHLAVADHWFGWNAGTFK